MNYHCATILIMLNLSNSTHAMIFFPAPYVHHYRSSKHGTTHHHNRHQYYNDHSQRHQGRPQHTSLHPRDMARLLAQQALFFAQQQQMQAAYYAAQAEQSAHYPASSTYGSSYDYESSSSSERRSKPVSVISCPVPADRSTPQSWRSSQKSQTPKPTVSTPTRDELAELLAETDAQSDELKRAHLEELRTAVESGDEQGITQALKIIEQGEDRFIAEFILGAGAVGALYSFFTDNSTERTQVAQMYADCKKLTASLIEQQKIIKKLQDTNAEILAGEQENAARLDKIHDGVQKLNENTVAMMPDGKLVQKMTREEFETAQLAKQPRRGHHRLPSSESDATEVPQTTKRISPFARLRAFKLAQQGK